MADKSSSKWQEAERQILAATNLADEFAALGLRVADKKPSAKGWLACHAWGVEDKEPSAGINVLESSPFFGRYKDFRGGKTCSLWVFAAETAGRFGGKWREARAHYARQAGVTLPSGEEELVADKFDFSTLTFSPLNFYAKGKAGVTVQAIQEVGGIGATWPKGLPAEKLNHLIAFPMYGSALLDLEPGGWHCVAQNPRGRIRKFQGHGHEEKLLDKMTVGDYGLMNVWAIHRLAEAEVVNVCEGITDLLAGHAALRAWDGSEAGDQKHVILSAGGCSYHPKPEWLQHFAGKDVRLWFDVGDGKDEGQIAAAVWAGALVKVAKSVRNVQLPLGTAGGKNDLRQWLVGDEERKLTPHTYADMLALAETFEPIASDDTGAQVSRHEAILKNLGLAVVGEHEGTQKIEIFSDVTKKSGTIHDIDKLTVAKLVQYSGAEVVERYVHDGKEPQPDKFQIKDVRHAIAAAASDKLFHGEERHGAGVWEIERQLVLVKSQEAGVVSLPAATTPKIDRSHMPFYKGRILDLSRSTADWYEAGALSRHLASAGQDTFCWQAFEEVDALFGKWYWRHKPSPRMVASLVICSWLQTLWEWRPEVFITGGSDTGKSLLLEDVINRGIFGALALYVQKPTEAAIRQHMRHHAKILLVDEFEHDNHRQRILELFRTSSRGGDTIRGTADQRGAKYRLRHIPWFAAIETGLRKQADRNRYIIFELDDIPGDKRGNIDLPSTERLRDLGQRLLAVGLRHVGEAKRLAALLKGQQFVGVPGRVVESFSVPCAMVSAIYGHTFDVARDMMQNTLAGWDFGSQSSRDDIDLLQEIFTAEVSLDGGRRSSVSQLLHRIVVGNDPDVTAALARVGIRRIAKRGKHRGELALFLCHGTIRKQLLRNSEYQGHSIEQYLMRLAGATAGKHHLGGGEKMHGVEVPMATIEKVFAGNGDDEDGESTSGHAGNGEAMNGESVLD